MTPESLVAQTETLFSFPDAAYRVQELIEAPSTRAQDLAEVILCDAALTARLLRLVNSPVFAPASPVTKVAQAVNLLGTRALRDLVFATCAIETFAGLPEDGLNMEHFWRYSVTSGIAARTLASERGLPASEHLFLIGLVHGLGKLILLSQCPTQVREVMQRLGKTATIEETAAAEEQVLGFNYAELGATLLKAWRFPDSIWVPVQYHLQPGRAPTHRLETETLWASVSVASDMLAADLAKGDEPGSVQIPEPERIAKPLRLPAESIARLPLEIELEILEMLEILIPGCSLIP
ncbi:HDOD domain-containing protein [Thiorhodococcus minor]|uniref:HDOD domain-containing protein n=1 Tax=Thiorhodococcus minor TaxID=57489 RepID=A0A6M0JZE9_9GAMM|nr:HDOD domain-containing protein [Thiorhodococcus minor]NEV61727.1 HDOD domain-containing protein [Thiorhodococcus minor]